MVYNGDMVTLNAHFDGKVVVPNEPTGLAAGTRVRVILEPLDHGGSPGPRRLELPLLTGVDERIVGSIMEDPEFEVGYFKIERFLGPAVPEKPK